MTLVFSNETAAIDSSAESIDVGMNSLEIRHSEGILACKDSRFLAMMSLQEASMTSIDVSHCISLRGSMH